MEAMFASTWARFSSVVRLRTCIVTVSLPSTSRPSGVPGIPTWTFRSWMSTPENLKLYHQKTRENIQKLFNWVESGEAALPVERSELWSEGEDNFEARLDAILAQR